MVRRKAAVNAVQYPNTDLLEDLNELKDELWSAIAHRLQDDYNWERWYAASVAGQTEYTVPEAASNLSGLKTIKGVALMYGDEFKKATLVNPQTLPKHWDYYVANQSADAPLYFVSDRSVFIAPAFGSENAGADRIELSGLRNIVDWTIDADEAEMRIPVDFQRVLVYGLMPRALTSKGADLNEVLGWETHYKTEREAALKNMSNRVDTAVQMNYPDETAGGDEIVIW